MASTFTIVFVAFLAMSVTTHSWLACRQIRCVRGHRDEVPAAFSGHVDQSSHRRAADYTVARARVDLAETAIDATLLLALTLGGGVAMLTRAIASIAWPPLLGNLALVGAVAAVTGFVALPLSWWRTFRVEARFGFNQSTLPRWLADAVLLAAVAIVVGAPLAFAVLWLMRNAGAQWWLAAWGVWVAFQIAAAGLYPLLIAPLFNRFSPLPPGVVRERVEALLARCRFDSARLFVADGSRRSSHGNAWFAGLGHTRRVVFFDTLLARLTPEEVEAVLAHEIGHYRLHHVAKRIAGSSVVTFALFAVIAGIAHAGWFAPGLGVPATDPAFLELRPALVLVLSALALPVFAFPLAPLASAWSRHHEFAADAFAARHAPASALIEALARLYADNASTLTPDPLYAAFHYSHPPAAARIARLGGKSK